MKQVFLLASSLLINQFSFSQGVGNDGSLRGGVKSQRIDVVPPLRAHHALVYDEEEKRVLLTGGSTPIEGGQRFIIYNDVWAFDGKRWEQLGNAGDKRSGIGIAYNGRAKELVSFGGYSNDGALADLRIYENNDWKIKANKPEMIATEPGFVYDSDRDRYVAFGGSAGRGKVNADTWEWDGKEWMKKDIPGPPGRQAFAMVYDAKRKRTILFGGMGETPEKSYNDTWEYDGAKWERVDTGGPGNRLAMGYTYDSKRGLVLIFGGMGPNGILGDTWGWDGKSWTQLSATGPSPRLMGYMAYDKARDKTVLFGGRIKWPQDANDTWEWDGERWSEVNFEN